MTAHTKEQREFVVLRLARFDPPSEIVAAFLARWPDTSCTLVDVEDNDPRHTMLPPDLHEAFKVERERVLLDPASAPTADRRVRLIALDRMYQFARDRGAVTLAAEFLAQIKSEMDTAGVAAGPQQGGASEKRITRTVVDPVPAVAAS